MVVHVKNGTHAGWRLVAPERPKKDWICPVDGKALRYYWARCPECGHPRPEE